METFLVENVPTAWLGVLVVGVSLAVALGGFLLVQRTVERNELRSQHDVAGFLFAVVGVIYAVLLAFMVVIQWESFTGAEQDANAEAAAVGGLYRDAVALGAAGRPLRRAVAAYAHGVAYVEWPYMAVNQREDPRLDVPRNRIWKALRELKAEGAAASHLVQQALDDASTAADARRARVRDSGRTLPPTLWTVLIVGGILTIAFCYFFGLQSFRAQAAMIAILAGLIGLSLLVILTLDLPFTGSVATGPDAMIAEIDEFCSYDFARPLLAQRCSAR